MKNNERLKELFQRYLDNKCTPAELRLLLQYFDAGENEALLRDLIRKQSEDINAIPFSSGSLKPLLDAAYGRIQSSIRTGAEPVGTPVIPLYHRLWFRISAAATVVLFVSLAAFYFLQQNSDDLTSQTQSSTTQQVKDIPPGINSAILTLDNGTTIVLDSVADGALAQQGGIKTLKMNGQIVYDKTGNAGLQAAPIYNTIATARANQYMIVLEDGSKVWLNAASSIRFPSYFTGNERKVEITGEVYFEVAKDAARPFKVEFNNALGEKGEVEVLGTHFNVNAYPDEENIKTTLLEGSVKVSKGSESVLIVPGEQANLSGGSPLAGKGITIKKDVVLSQVVAWKDGFFVFNNSDIKMIMKQVARWYDVEVVFEGKMLSERFTGKVSRNVSLSNFLKMLELNDVHVKTEGRKIIITP